MKHPFRSDFLLTDTGIIRTDRIDYLDLTSLESRIVRVYLKYRREPLTVSGFAALEFVYRIHPSALEGRRLKWKKYAWAVHNLIAHPVLQICAFLGFYKFGMWVHDVTVPKPIRDEWDD